MKKKLSLFSILITLTAISADAQTYWKSYQKGDGLIDSIVVDFALGENKIFIATPEGFSILENEQFTNYDTSNSSLISQNIKIIRSYQDTVYLVTDSGLTEFSNGNFINYSTRSGLISSKIEDIEVDSKGVLYIGYLNGFGIKSGNSFVNDPSKVIYDLAINSGDSVYANTTSNVVGNIPNRTTAELFVNGTWKSISDPNLMTPILNVKLFNLSNGRVGGVSSSGVGFSVANEFSLSEYSVPNTSVPNSLMNSIDVDSDTNYWFAMGSRTSNLGVVFELRNDSVYSHTVGLPNPSINMLKCFGGKVYIGTRNGFAFASDSIPNYPEVLSLETSSIRAHFSARNGIFSNRQIASNQNNSSILELSGLRFPKGSNTALVYSAGNWLSSNDNSTQLYLSTENVGSIRNNFKAGTVNSNNSAVRQSILYITKEDISFHLRNFRTADYKMPESVKNWPAKAVPNTGEAEDQAPFIDVNSNGCYDPENGDYPAIMGDKVIYLIVNDDTEEQDFEFHKRFKMEIHTMAYVFDIPDIKYIDQSVFLRTTYINRSSNTYQNVNVGSYYDMDIGNPFNDANGCDLSSNSFFGYSIGETDSISNISKGYGDYPPFLGVKYINESLYGHGMPRFFSSTGQARNALDNLWYDSLSISVGGDGRNTPTLNKTNFLYPGRLDRANEWSFIHPGSGFSANTATDIRSIGIVKWTDWKPGERKVVDQVVTIAQDSSRMANYRNYNVLMDYLERASRFQKGVDSITPNGIFGNCATSLLESEKNIESKNSIIVYPNPNQGALSVLGNGFIQSIVVYNIQGALVYKKAIGSSTPLIEIELPESLTNGLYILKTQFKDSNDFVTKRFVLQR